MQELNYIKYRCRDKYGSRNLGNVAVATLAVRAIPTPRISNAMAIALFA